MHFSLLIAGLLLGLDSFLVSVPLGATRLSARHRLRLAVAFALCDGLASFLGWVAGMAEWHASFEPLEWLGPLAVGGYGFYVLNLAWHSRRLAESGAGGWLALGLPLCLSLDNLAAGLGSEESASSAALVALASGLISGCQSLIGLQLGAAISTRVRVREECFVGAALVVLALVLLCKETLA
jgi:putative Mn2+ efflux pump MntP